MPVWRGARSPGWKGNLARVPCSSSRGRGFGVGRAGVSNMDDLVDDSVTANGSAGVNGMDVVDAAANGVLLDNSDAHFGGFR